MRLYSVIENNLYIVICIVDNDALDKNLKNFPCNLIGSEDFFGGKAFSVFDKTIFYILELSELFVQCIDRISFPFLLCNVFFRLLFISLRK